MRIAKTINTLRFKGGPCNAVQQTAITALLLGLCFFGNVQTAASQSIVYDNSGLKIELSNDVQAAIDSGVSLTFESEIVHISRFLFLSWNKPITQHDFVVTRHSLSNRYLVHESNTLEPRIFSSTRETMAYISEATLTRFAKYQPKQQSAPKTEKKTPEHRMRLRLSKTKLLGPMRLTAFISNDWNLNSGWKSWQSDQ